MTDAPPQLARSLGVATGRPLRVTRWLWLVGGVALIALALLYTYRPEGQFFFPRCTFHTATGLLCPGCGGQRATHALLHGQFAEAFRANALLVAGLPAAFAWWLWHGWQKKSAALSSKAIWIVFAVSLAFGVLRNLPIPAAAWLSP